MAEPNEADSLDEVMRRATKRLETEGRLKAASPDELDQILKRAQQQPENQSGGFLKSMGVFLNHMGDAASFGGTDYVTGKLKPGSSVEEQRAKTQQEGITNPYAAIAGDVVGTMLPSGIASKVVGKMIPAIAGPAWKAGAAREGIVGGAQPVVDAMARGETPTFGESLAGGTLSAVAGAISPTLQRFISPKGKISQFDVTPDDVGKMREFAKLGDKYKVPMNLDEIAKGAKVAAPDINAATTTATNLPGGSKPNYAFQFGRQDARQGLQEGMDWLGDAIKTPGAKPTALKTLPGTSPAEALKEGRSILEVVPKGAKPAIDQFTSDSTSGMVRDWMKNLPAGPTVKRMQDPSSIDLIGKRTPGLIGTQAATTSAANELDLADEWMRLVMKEEERKSRVRKEK